MSSRPPGGTAAESARELGRHARGGRRGRVDVRCTSPICVEQRPISRRESGSEGRMKARSRLGLRRDNVDGERGRATRGKQVCALVCALVLDAERAKAERLRTCRTLPTSSSCPSWWAGSAGRARCGVWRARTYGLRGRRSSKPSGDAQQSAVRAHGRSRVWAPHKPAPISHRCRVQERSAIARVTE